MAYNLRLTTDGEAIKPICIVGAGPGNPELLTIRAFNRLKNAQVVLHDNLVPKEIIDLIPPSAILINVGRKFGDLLDQKERQDNIHELMNKYALEGKNLVRLKSGDPFIYGRAIEEIKYLIDQNIPFEVVPGITAGIAAANLECIPLTERHATNSLVFCTGHTASYDYTQLEALGNMLRTGSTLVMYMGLKALKEVVSKFKEVVPEETIHISAVSHVSLSTQAMVAGTLDDIEEKIKKQHLEMPVVFIMGKYSFPIKPY